MALSFVIRAGYCAYTHLQPYPFADSYREYIIAGQRLLEHHAFLSPFMTEARTAEPSALLPPLYTIWVASVYALFGVEKPSSIFVLELANSVALALACGLAFQLGKELRGELAGWVAGLMAAINPALIGHTHYVWDTSFFALAVALSTWYCVRLRNRPFRPVSFFGLGCLLGAVALLNPALTIAYPLIVAFPLLRKEISKKQLAAGVALSVLGWALVITPWTIRNYRQFGKLEYVRSGIMLELWLGAVPEAEYAGSEVYPKYFPLNNVEVARHVAEVGEKAFVEECGLKAREAIAGDPVRFVRLSFKRALDYWAGTVLTHANVNNDVIPASRQRLLIMLVFSCEVVVVVLGILLRRISGGAAWWLLSILALFSLIYCITHVQVRFRVPVEPLMAVLAAMALTRRSDSPNCREQARGHLVTSGTSSA